MSNILVTGGAGYIGSHTCKALSQAGHNPVCLDDLSAGRADFVRWGPMVKLSLSDSAGIEQAIREHAIDAVIHFAGSIEAGRSMVEPAAFYRNNVTNTLILLDAMRATGVNKIVFSSSAAVYGIPESSPISEDHPTLPVNAYGETKLAIERVLYWYRHAYGLQYAALRYFNAAGADADGEVGECHDPETHLIPLILRACLTENGRLRLFGNDYPTPDGTAVRDYIHVGDLAQAHLAALNWMASTNESLVVNVGSGEGHSNRELIEACSACLNMSVPYDNAPRRAGDPPILIADIRLANSTLGWVPMNSTIENIVLTAYRWHKSEMLRIV